MRKNQVVVGRIYLCRVSGNLIEVEVLKQVTDYFTKRTKFQNKNVRTGKQLPKNRSAAALREKPNPDGRMPSDLSWERP